MGMKKVQKQILSIMSAVLVLFGASSFEVSASEETFDLSESGAEQIFQEFLNDTSFIKEDSTWKDFIELLDIPVNLEPTSKMYAENVDTGFSTEDEATNEFKEMSSYDKMLWDTTYLFMADMITKGNYKDASDYDKVIEHSASATFYISVTGDRNERDKVLSAYEKLYKWQVEYITANGGPYNFINKRSYMDERGIETVVDDSAQKYEEEQKEVKEVKSAVIESMNEDEIETLNEETKKETNKSLPIIALVIVVLVGVIAVGFIKFKGKNNRNQKAA